MISDITDICVVSLQYELSCVFSDHCHRQMISDKQLTCVRLLFSKSSHVCIQQMITDITDIYLGFSSMSCNVRLQLTNIRK